MLVLSILKTWLFHSYLILMEFMIQLTKGVCERSLVLRVCVMMTGSSEILALFSQAMQHHTPEVCVILTFTTLRTSDLRLQSYVGTYLTNYLTSQKP
jgi:hypothetical protein